MRNIIDDNIIQVAIKSEIMKNKQIDKDYKE